MAGRVSEWVCVRVFASVQVGYVRFSVFISSLCDRLMMAVVVVWCAAAAVAAAAAAHRQWLQRWLAGGGGGTGDGGNDVCIVYMFLVLTDAWTKQRHSHSFAQCLCAFRLHVFFLSQSLFLSFSRHLHLYMRYNMQYKNCCTIPGEKNHKKNNSTTKSME